MADTLTEAQLTRLGQNLRKVRDRACMHAEEVAGELGRSAGYVWQIERGTHAPPLSVLLQLKRIYKLKTVRPFFEGLE